MLGAIQTSALIARVYNSLLSVVERIKKYKIMTLQVGHNLRNLSVALTIASTTTDIYLDSDLKITRKIEEAVSSEGVLEIILKTLQKLNDAENLPSANDLNDLKQRITSYEKENQSDSTKQLLTRIEALYSNFSNFYKNRLDRLLTPEVTCLSEDDKRFLHAYLGLLIVENIGLQALYYSSNFSKKFDEEKIKSLDAQLEYDLHTSEIGIGIIPAIRKDKLVSFANKLNEDKNFLINFQRQIQNLVEKGEFNATNPDYVTTLTLLLKMKKKGGAYFSLAELHLAFFRINEMFALEDCNFMKEIREMVPLIEKILNNFNSFHPSIFELHPYLYETFRRVKIWAEDFKKLHRAYLANPYINSSDPLHVRLIIEDYLKNERNVDRTALREFKSLCERYQLNFATTCETYEKVYQKLYPNLSLDEEDGSQVSAYSYYKHILGRVEEDSIFDPAFLPPHPSTFKALNLLAPLEYILIENTISDEEVEKFPDIFSNNQDQDAHAKKQEELKAAKPIKLKKSKISSKKPDEHKSAVATDSSGKNEIVEAKPLAIHAKPNPIPPKAEYSYAEILSMSSAPIDHDPFEVYQDYSSYNLLTDLKPLLNPLASAFEFAALSQLELAQKLTHPFDLLEKEGMIKFESPEQKQRFEASTSHKVIGWIVLCDKILQSTSAQYAATLIKTHDLGTQLNLCTQLLNGSTTFTKNKIATYLKKAIKEISFKIVKSLSKDFFEQCSANQIKPFELKSDDITPPELLDTLHAQMVKSYIRTWVTVVDAHHPNELIITESFRIFDNADTVKDSVKRIEETCNKSLPVSHSYRTLSSRMNSNLLNLLAEILIIFWNSDFAKQKTYKHVNNPISIQNNFINFASKIIIEKDSIFSRMKWLRSLQDLAPEMLNKNQWVELSQAFQLGIADRKTLEGILRKEKLTEKQIALMRLIKITCGERKIAIEYSLDLGNLSKEKRATVPIALNERLRFTATRTAQNFSLAMKKNPKKRIEKESILDGSSILWLKPCGNCIIEWPIYEALSNAVIRSGLDLSLTTL